MDLKLAVISHQSLSTLGGISVHIRQLAEAIVKLGVDVEVIAPAYSKVADSSSYSFKLAPILVGSRLQTMRTLEYSYKVYKYLLENRRRFDAVHGSQWSMLLPCLKKHEIGLPMITKFHGTFFHGVVNTMIYETRHWLFNEAGEALALPIYTYIESTCARKSDGIICISKSVKKEALSLSYCNCGREMRVIYNGVDPERFKPFDYDGIHEVYGVNEGDRVVLYVGLLQPRKGVHHLIKVVRRMLKEYPKLKVLIAGKGEKRYTNYLHRIAKPKDRFKFLGKAPHDRLPELYNLAEVCVMPSIYEPLGNVALEAMACGKPVLAGNTGGLREIIIQGKTGFLLSINNMEKDIIYYLSLLFNDDHLRKSIGRNARKYVETSFSWRRTAEMTIKFIEELLS